MELLERETWMAIDLSDLSDARRVRMTLRMVLSRGCDVSAFSRRWSVGKFLRYLLRTVSVNTMVVS